MLLFVFGSFPLKNYIVIKQILDKIETEVISTVVYIYRLINASLKVGVDLEHYEKTIRTRRLMDGNAVSTTHFSGVSFTFGIVKGDQLLIPTSITIFSDHGEYKFWIKLSR